MVSAICLFTICANLAESWTGLPQFRSFSEELNSADNTIHESCNSTLQGEFQTLSLMVTGGVGEPSAPLSPVKVTVIKKSKSTGTKNITGSGVFHSSIDVESPIASSGFYGNVRKHIDGLVRDWIGKLRPGKLTVRLPLRAIDFCSLQVTRYEDLGSPSLSSTTIDCYLLQSKGSSIGRFDFKNCVRPDAWRQLERRLFQSQFFSPYTGEKSETPNQHEAQFDAVVPYPNFVRAFFDSDGGRGRFIVCDTKYESIEDWIKPDSAIGKFLGLGTHAIRTNDKASPGAVPQYASIPKEFSKMQFSVPWPWEEWYANPPFEGEIWRSTVDKSRAKDRLKKIMDRLQLDAVLFKKIRTRTGKDAFGGTLENYSARYSEEENYPKDSIAVWRGTKGNFERIIVTVYPEPQRQKMAQIMTDQLAAEAKQFLGSK